MWGVWVKAPAGLTSRTASRQRHREYECKHYVVYFFLMLRPALGGGMLARELWWWWWWLMVWLHDGGKGHGCLEERSLGGQDGRRWWM